MAGKNGEPVEESNQDLHGCKFSLAKSFDSEILDSSCSLSFPSEPPDIRNWFSSYEYESPVLDIGDGLESFSSGEGGGERKGFRFEEINRENEDSLGEFNNSRSRGVALLVVEKKSLNGIVGCQTLVGDNKQEHQILNKDNHLIDCTKKHFVRKLGVDESLDEAQVQSHDSIPSKNVDEDSGLNGGDSLKKLDEKFSEEDNLILWKINNHSSIEHGKSPKELLERKVLNEKRLETKVPATQADYLSPEDNVEEKRINGVLMKNSVGRRDDKDNEGKVIGDDGFILTRKKKIIRKNDENFGKRNPEDHVENLRNVVMISRVVKGDAIIGRKALSERTNLQCGSVQEIAGKWRCPQKNKSDLGPPLKQLRLEQWVHRV